MLSMYGNSEDFKEYDKALQNIQERCFALEAKNKALVERLSEDGLHDAHCPKKHSNGAKCICGLDELLKEV